MKQLLFSLLILLFSQKVKNFPIIKLPRYPTNTNTYTNTNTNNNGDTTNTASGMPSRGTTISEIAKNFYKESLNSNYVLYPEPHSGWEGGSCKDSIEQSPINIPHESDINIIKDSSKVKILSVNYNNLGSGNLQFQQNYLWGVGILDGGFIKLMIDSIEYSFILSEINIHLYSEHRILNKQYPIELQLVHYNSGYQLNKEKLVISILFDYTKNVENIFLNELRVDSRGQIQNAEFGKMVTGNQPFYYYKGGLTVPPCSNNVHYIVFSSIHDMSYMQFENIKNWIEGGHRYYYATGYGNARGVKPLNGRKIYYEKNNYNSINGQNQNQNQNDTKYTFVDSSQFINYKIFLFAIFYFLLI